MHEMDLKQEILPRQISSIYGMAIGLYENVKGQGRGTA